MIALVITIIVLILLAGVSIHLVLGKNGILEKAKTAREMTEYATAKEKIEMKIMAVQTTTYSERQEDATLQEVADTLSEDNEIEYVELETQKIGALKKIQVGEAEKIYTKLKAYSYEFEIGRDLKVIVQKLEEEIPKVAYEGLGYQFIYNGSMQEAGIDGKNMCHEVTGGWTSNRAHYSMNGVSGYYRGYISTNNKIDLTEYAKLCISSYIETSGSGIFNIVWGKRDQFPDPNTPEKLEEDEFMYTNKGENLDLIDIPKNFNHHIIVYSCHSQANTYYFDYRATYMRNYTMETRYIDVYHIVALKEDDWRTWAKIGQIDVDNEETNTLEKILNNGEIMQQMYQNTTANQYLLRCSGTLMMEILKNDNSYQAIPESLKEKMKQNEHWNSFFKVCKREN